MPAVGPQGRRWADGTSWDTPLDDHEVEIPVQGAERPGDRPVHYESAAVVGMQARNRAQAQELADRINREITPRPRPPVVAMEVQAAYGLEAGTTDLSQLHGMSVSVAWGEVQRHRAGRVAPSGRLDLDGLSHTLGRSTRTVRRWLHRGLIPVDAQDADGTWSRDYATALATIAADLRLGAHRLTPAQVDQFTTRAARLRDTYGATGHL
ncbi:MAG: hypothetical protein ACLPKI_25095 [Streptosporangiaceae bacterium]